MVAKQGTGCFCRSATTQPSGRINETQNKALSPGTHTTTTVWYGCLRSCLRPESECADLASIAATQPSIGRYKTHALRAGGRQDNPRQTNGCNRDKQTARGRTLAASTPGIYRFTHVLALESAQRVLWCDHALAEAHHNTIRVTSPFLPSFTIRCLRYPMLGVKPLGQQVEKSRGVPSKVEHLRQCRWVLARLLCLGQ